MKRTLFLSFFMFFTAWAMPMGSQPFAMPSAEELEKMNQEIEAFRASMTQEQRDEFDKQVEELANVMKDMPEDELNKFIDTIFNDPSVNQIPPTPPTPTPAPTPIKEVKPEEPLYKPSTVSTKTIQSSKSLLGAIINQSESFLRKASLISDLYGPLNTWVPVAVLADKKNLTWQELKQDIEKLISSLKVALATDPATGHYYYLSSLIENDALYQNIIRLHDALMRNESNIEVAAFGLGDLTKESRKATSTVLSAFVQAIITQQMTAEIQKLFSAFEPQAKKVIEQEESARKRAIEESKKTISQAPMRSGGTVLEDYSSSTGYKPGLSDTYGYDSISSMPAPSYTPSSSNQPSGFGESRSTQQPAGAVQPIASGDKKATDEAAKKQKTETPAPDKKASDTADKIMEKIAGFIEDCIIGMKAKKLDLTVMDPDKQEAVDEAAGRIARIVSRIKTLENVIKDFTNAQKDVYFDQIKIMIKEEKDLFDAIITATDEDKDNPLRKQIEALFKKLDIVHTKKTATPKPTAKKTAQQESKTDVKPTQPHTQTEQALVSTAEINPASLPTEIGGFVRDIHPAAMQPTFEGAQ